jgi:hypothetical protein
MPKQTAIWIDHHEARIFHLDVARTSDEAVATVPLRHGDHPARASESKKGPSAKKTKRFFAEVGRSLRGKGDILLVGPASTKLAFLRYVHKHHRKIDERIVAIETVLHPPTAAFLTYAKAYFHTNARLP